jgi:hypothetical protein
MVFRSQDPGILEIHMRGIGRRGEIDDAGFEAERLVVGIVQSLQEQAVVLPLVFLEVEDALVLRIARAPFARQKRPFVAPSERCHFLADIVDREHGRFRPRLGDDGAASLAADHETVRGEPRQDLVHGHARDTVMFGEFRLFRQRETRRPGAVHDLAGKLVEYPAVKRIRLFRRHPVPHLSQRSYARPVAEQDTLSIILILRPPIQVYILRASQAGRPLMQCLNLDVSSHGQVAADVCRSRNEFRAGAG